MPKALDGKSYECLGCIVHRDIAGVNRAAGKLRRRSADHGWVRIIASEAYTGISYDDPRALPCETFRDGESNTARTARDDRDAAGQEVAHSIVILSFAPQQQLIDARENAA